MAKKSLFPSLNWRSPSLKKGLRSVLLPNFGLPNFEFKSVRFKFDLRDPRFLRADDEDSEDYNFWGIFFTSFLIFTLCAAFFRHALPFGVASQWHTSGTLLDWLRSAAPIFAWGAGLTTIASVLTWNEPSDNRKAEKLYAKGIATSLLAGVLEEIAFRWIIFYASIALSLALNFLLLGFAGFGLIELVHNYFFGPIVNFFTLGHLSNWLVNKELWYIGAGMISANGLFRDGHKYLGPVGFINSWFIGMFMFALLQDYGLVACIVCHFVYDLLIFTVRYIDMFIERLIGRY
ncbi:MAG: hypothetical protein SFV17_12690 [Candidatus Obscuribacter sp.]|nr:hypothetical protein [Candidatus Obscuribacter sp.]